MTAKPAKPMTSTPASSQPTEIGLRERFRFGQLNRWALWPFWLGVVLAALSLTLNWSESWSIAGQVNCEYGMCPGTSVGSQYIDHDADPASAAAAGILWPALAAIAVLLAWGMHRRDIAVEDWFSKLPIAALVVLGGAALLNVQGVFEGWTPPGGEEMTAFGYSEPATGVILMLIAIVPLWFGIGRVRGLIGEPAVRDGG